MDFRARELRLETVVEDLGSRGPHDEHAAGAVPDTGAGEGEVSGRRVARPLPANAGDPMRGERATRRLARSRRVALHADGTLPLTARAEVGYGMGRGRVSGFRIRPRAERRALGGCCERRRTVRMSGWRLPGAAMAGVSPRRLDCRDGRGRCFSRRCQERPADLHDPTPRRMTDSRLEAEALLLENLAWVDRVVGSVSRRNGLRGDDAEDFASWTRVKLVEDDYAVIRKFRGESAITTYLTVVITMLAREYRATRWGRWRPSAAAQRQGPLGVRLETLVYRDGHTLDQAAEVLRTNGETDLSARELAEMLGELNVRGPLRPVEVGPQPLASAVSDSSADEIVRAEESETGRRQVVETLERAIETLPPQDRIIVRLRFWEGMSVADIARGLDLPQKPLYRRLTKALEELRTQLEAAGVSMEMVRTRLGEVGESAGATI